MNQEKRFVGSWPMGREGSLEEVEKNEREKRWGFLAGTMVVFLFAALASVFMISILGGNDPARAIRIIGSMSSLALATTLSIAAIMLFWDTKRGKEGKKRRVND